MGQSGTVDDPNWPVAVRESGTVLIVDDDDEVAVLLAELLTGSGYVVMTANNGELAMELIERESPSVVIVDLVLPGRDGYQVAVSARQQLGARVALIAITGYLNDKAITYAYHCGCDVVVTKPFDLSALLETIDRVQPRPLH